MGEILPFKQDASFLNGAGKKAAEAQDFVTAVPLLNKAVELEPDNVDYRVDLAMCYMAMEEIDEARDTMEDVLASGRELPPAAFMAYAHTYVVEGDFRIAIGLLKQVKDDDIEGLLNDDEDDEAFDGGYDDGPDITLADDSGAVNRRLRDLVEDRNVKGVLELIGTIDKRSFNYPEALKGAAMIYLAKGMKKKARPYLLEALERLPDDIYALTSMAMIEQDPAAREDYMERLKTVEPHSDNEVGRICQAALSAGAGSGSIELVEALYKGFPYQKDVLEALIKLYADFGMLDRARETALYARRLYPRDMTFAELNRLVADLQGPGELALEFGLGNEEVERRVDELESWLERKSSVQAAVKGLKENSRMDEYVRWLFQTDLFSVQANVGCFLAQSPKWQPFIRAQLLKDIPDALKYEYIRSLLFYAPDKRYRLISGDSYYEYEPVSPVPACEAFLDAYYTAFAGLSVSQDEFEPKLDSLFTALVRGTDGDAVEGKDDSVCIAAAMVKAAHCRKPYLGKRDICDLFGVGPAELDEYEKLYFFKKKKGGKHAGL